MFLDLLFLGFNLDLAFQEMVDDIDDVVTTFKELKDDIISDIEELAGELEELKLDLFDRIEDEISPEVAKVVRVLDKTSVTQFNALGAKLPKLKFIDDDISIGDHIKVNRATIYTHHGIYIGNDTVIHYHENLICTTTIESFKGLSVLEKVNSAKRYSPDEIVQRAKSRMYESSYHLLTNNSEHFARWCRCGE